MPRQLAGSTGESTDALTVGEGLDATQFAAITRSDGPLQVAFNDAPLYYFIGDAAPGDTNGDGVGDVWHLALAPPAADFAVAIGPNGEPTAAAATTVAASRG